MEEEMRITGISISIIDQVYESKIGSGVIINDFISKAHNRDDFRGFTSVNVVNTPSFYSSDDLSAFIVYNIQTNRDLIN